MINDAGKHEVKGDRWAVSLSGSYLAVPGDFFVLVAKPDAKPVPTFAGFAPP
jgi:hypothetical protein